MLKKNVHRKNTNVSGSFHVSVNSKIFKSHNSVVKKGFQKDKSVKPKDYGHCKYQTIAQASQMVALKYRSNLSGTDHGDSDGRADRPKNLGVVSKCNYSNYSHFTHSKSAQSSQGVALKNHFSLLETDHVDSDDRADR